MNTPNITVSRELLRQVLEVLKKGDTYFISPAGDLTKPTIAALRAALEQAPVQEPPGRCPSCMTYNGHQDGCPTTPQPAPAERTVQEPSCKWPSCQTEQYQNDLADHIAKELIGEQPRKAVKLSDSEILTALDVEYVSSAQNRELFLSDARTIEQAVWAKLGVSE